MVTEPKGSSPPRADELVDPVRMTRSVPHPTHAPHLDLPHPRGCRSGEGKRGQGGVGGSRLALAMRWQGALWAWGIQTCGRGVLNICRMLL